MEELGVSRDGDELGERERERLFAVAVAVAVARFWDCKMVYRDRVGEEGKNNPMRESENPMV